ncbi:MAG TPA: dihydroorotate dehydrogenase (quinone) [Blastocatellia bacterium]|jgi:dihydroorotate dehydrogenase|nr:dihydroorotate dehydrogenase (quinone) [Blastocatellia bacterium]HAF22305.1 dihydroorotate dehydrogenase (quinone) [Blastocatellia bacterium]HCX29366.1 dihydroorotate dehydrogenase (quinone) [Blastocatellia bacterium]
MLYRSLLRPLLFRLPPETAHELALHSLSFAPNLTKTLLGDRFKRSPFGKLRRFGLTFSNPVGLAAGFDKDGVALESLAALGFGFIEAGTVTYHPQPGNKRPRLFRLPQDKALINRAGFNNHGAAAFAQRVKRNRPDCVLGVSIGKSKVVPLADAVDDYLKSFAVVYPVADYVAVNVSSPNTPRLRELQQAHQLEELLQALQTRNAELAAQEGRSALLPLLVKLSPDLGQEEFKEIVEVAQRQRLAGLIAANTTTDRSRLQTDSRQVEAYGAGGLSGAPLKQRATQVIANLYNLTQGAMPLIGVGGIFTAEDAWEMISAGASLLQIYTGFIYEGPTITRDINENLRRIISSKGFVSLDEAVGCRAKELAGC